MASGLINAPIYLIKIHASKNAPWSLPTDETVVVIKYRNAYGIQTANGWSGLLGARRLIARWGQGKSEVSPDHGGFGGAGTLFQMMIKRSYVYWCIMARCQTMHHISPCLRMIIRSLVRS
ncbi:MAG: hypothetical protein A6F72_08560 [Cycloclasticus sp. symbiont of Poecilosclerida sp. N]|nr:MAG: hypothetical protein A6F72_08560 [Cycloclasticus sp. symbiont of Poecilosclerida sp. N]